MNTILPTVTIKREGVGPVRLNLADYKPDMGEILDSEPPLTADQLVALYGGDAPPPALPVEPPPPLDANGLRTDGPTIEEYLTAGYDAANYPPAGYAARSTPEEIAAAVAARNTPLDDDGNNPPPSDGQPVSLPALGVSKKGKKFFIVKIDDGVPFEHEKIDATGYAAEADAQAALVALITG